MRLRRAPRRLLVAQKINRRVRERDAMLDAHLHSLGGHGTQFEGGGELDLAPRHVQDLARPRLAQDDERERLCRCAGRGLELSHDGGNVGVGHAAWWPRTSPAAWEEMVEMAAPSRGIGAVLVDMAARPRPRRVDHRLDPAPQSRGGYGRASMASVSI
jgi:hypothetical protein